MHKQPVLLRRTASNIPAAPGSGGGAASIPVREPGSGGEVDPENSIPIADEDPGSVSASSHKRKQSGIPLDAEAIINRASVQTTSLEQIADEDEEVGVALSRSSSELDISNSNRSSGESPHGGGSSNMPEFSEIFPEEGWSLKSLLTSRGLAGMGLVLAVVAFFSLHSSSASTRHKGNPAASTGAAGVGAEVTPKSANPDDKGITVGEYHEEIVGKPMEHHVNEYNKIRFFDSPDKMKPIFSKGPILYNDEIGGLHIFENVCLTNNIDSLRYRPEPDTALRGLIYFTDDEEMHKNPKRCVPCSNHQPLENWESGVDNPDEKAVGHKCGMNGLHAMFASSVGDWTECIMEEENTKLMEEWGQTQAPLDVSTIHFFQDPTFLLQFNALDMEKSLFDMLMTYLPHWDKFLDSYNEETDEGGFPFDSVISHSLKGCLSHSHNWFCEVLHQMQAFGEAKEIPWESDDNTLYCYKELFYNQVGYQRNLDLGLVTKEIFGEFREMLFRKFGLPRRRTVADRLAEMEAEKKQNQGNKNKDGEEDGADDGEDTKIIFYDNKLSEEHVWNQMESLISKARDLEKFQNIKFVTVNEDFGELTVAQQARKFNEADAVIMARGDHMANAIFAVDGTSFVEVGCKVESLIGNPKFMDLMDGKYRAVERCQEGEGKDGSVCVVCKGEGDSTKFTMTPTAFEKLIDDVVASLEQ